MNDWLAYIGTRGAYSLTGCAKRVENDFITVFESGVCRFVNDSVMTDTEDLTIVINGLILNLKELLSKYGLPNLEQLAVRMYTDNPVDFFKDLRGQFTGLVFDKRTRKCLVFTNQTGDSAVFFHTRTPVYSSDFLLLSRFARENSLPVSFGTRAAQQMLTFGYMVDDSTFIKEVSRLQAGKRIVWAEGRQQVSTYHRFTSGGTQATEDEALETIDTLFRQAVRRCFDKDLEYGRAKHLADMSAGLDSRMTTVVAKSMGYGPITNISYSQTGSEEERLARQAATAFGDKLIFSALDDHKFIFDIDKLTAMNYGTYIYTGITGGERLLSTIDFEEYGAEHTGQLGDIVISTFVKGRSNETNPEEVRLSHTLSIDGTDPNSDNLPNQDVYSLYTRGFQGALSSWFVRKNYTYALSPFTDADLMTYCYSLPLEMRKNHNLYWKWIERYYPEALKVKSSRKKTADGMTAKAFALTGKVFMKGVKLLRLIGYKLKIVPSGTSPASNMNPYDYWYDTDTEMRTFMDGYFKANINLIDDEQLAKDLKTMFASRKVLDKLMALTVLSARKVFF